MARDRRQRAVRPSGTGQILAGLGEWLDSLPRWGFAIAAVFTVASITVIDYLTGDEVSFSAFYLLPVVVTAWFVSGTAAVVVGLVSAVVMALLQPGGFNPGGHPLVVFWNVAVNTGLFTISTILVLRTKTAISNETALSRIDDLTGVANGRAFQDRAALTLSEMRRSGRPLTFCYIDLDHFKRVNDSFGHREGDIVLQSLASVLTSRMRETDFVARLGGDEFGVLLPETGFAPAERVLHDIRAAATDALHQRWGVGLTIGAVTFMRPPSSIDDLLRITEDRLYEGKHAGRGRTEHVSWPEDELWAVEAES